MEDGSSDFSMTQLVPGTFRHSASVFRKELSFEI